MKCTTGFDYLFFNLLLNFIFVGIPTVTGNHTLYIVPYGSSVVLDCAISAKPSLTNIYWKQQVENTQSIVYAGESGTSGATLNNPSLTIHFATLPDSGYYRCFGTNVAGTSNGPQINLIVTGGKNSILNNYFRLSTDCLI